jgi:hypothetical protein
MMRSDGTPRGGLSPFEREKLLAGREARDSGSLSEADRKRLEEERAAGEAFLARFPDWKTLQARMPGPSAAALPGRRRLVVFRKPMAYALAACLALLLVPAILMHFPDSRPGARDFTVKGGAFFVLRINGRAVPARPGDTLQFVLHHDAPVRYSLQYRDDGGPWQAYLGPRPAAKAHAPEGEPVSHSIVLEPGWTEERIAAIAAPAEAEGDWTACLEPGSAPKPDLCRHLIVDYFVLANAKEIAP